LVGKKWAIRFNTDITLVIARNEYLGNNNAVLGCRDNNACNYNASATIEDCSCTYPVPNFDCNDNCIVVGNTCNDGNSETVNDVYNANCICVGESACKTNIVIPSNPFNLLQSLYESSQSIETDVGGPTGIDVIIRQNETIDLKSAHIKLNEGFKVENGACLNATIEPCE